MSTERLTNRKLNAEALDAMDRLEDAEKECAMLRQKLYGPIFERIVSTSMLHHALALSFDVPVNKLAHMVDLKAITLEDGPAVQLVVIPATPPQK